MEQSIGRRDRVTRVARIRRAAPRFIFYVFVSWRRLFPRNRPVGGGYHQVGVTQPALVLAERVQTFGRLLERELLLDDDLRRDYLQMRLLLVVFPENRSENGTFLFPRIISFFAIVSLI